MATLNELLGKLWEDYIHINPQAKLIHRLLENRDETILNDHIAFRTFDDPRVGIDVLAAPFVAFGYEAKESYDFPDKKLNARHFEHLDERQPKIFISELRVSDFSEFLQKTIGGLIDQVTEAQTSRWDFSVSGAPWSPIDYATYETLREESEYAGWTAAFGYRANHFTIFVNALKRFPTLEDLNNFLLAEGFTLNTSGGLIKGSAEVFLEQSSTMAPPARVKFSDGLHEIPGCYYEFARRYPLPNGKLFQGFVAKSADKIFESTDKGKG